ncbi:putative monooxygenase [Moniliophthora roreri]|nr:putative monooxygenase [Moniliophthora roreri]
MTTEPAVLIVSIESLHLRMHVYGFTLNRLALDHLVHHSSAQRLVLALLLLGNNVSVRIIDKRSNFNVGQRGAGFHARTLELYKLLGILPEIEKRARSVPTLRIYDIGQDKPLKEVPFLEKSTIESQYYRINGKVFGQEQHQELLRQILEEEYGCRVECETELESFAQDEEKVVVNLVKKGKQETTNVKWLVGADGGRSVVRKQLGLTFTGESHADVTSVVGDIEVKKWPDDFDTKVWSLWGNHREKTVFICPYVKDGKQMSFFFLGGGQVDVEGVAAHPEHIVDMLHGISGRQGIEFGALHQHALWRANVRMANKFGEGRIFIVGVLFFGNSISDVQESLEFVAKYPNNVVKRVLVLPQGSELSSDSEKDLLDRVFVDGDGHAYENYRVRPGDVFTVVVRPDGYIGALAKGSSGLKDCDENERTTDEVL